MIYISSIVLVILGLVGLCYGYAKNNRNIMLVSGLLLLLGGSLTEITRGFLAGIHGR